MDPPTRVQAQVGCAGGGGGGLENKLKNEVKKSKVFPQNDYKTQTFVPAASNFRLTGSFNIYIFEN